MLAREDFGRREHRPLRARLHRHQQRHRRDQRLARSDIALQQPQHRRLLRQIALDLTDRPRLRTGGRVGQLEQVAQPSIPRQRAAAAFAGVRADERHRKLVGEHLVIGQPLAGLRIRGIGVDTLQRLAPAGPAPLSLQPGLDPFGQIGRARDRLRREGCEPARGQPFRQRIDRLALLERLAGLAEFGVNDLEFLPVAIEPPRHALHLARGEQLLRIARRAAEIDQPDMIARRIERIHPRRPASGARPVIARGQRDRDRAPDIRLVQRFARHAVDVARGQMERDIDDPREPEPVERLGQRGADALQRGDLGEQRIEDIGAHHGSSCQRKLASAS